MTQLHHFWKVCIVCQLPLTFINYLIDVTLKHYLMLITSFRIFFLFICSSLPANQIANTTNSPRLSVSTLGSISASRLLEEWNQDDSDSDSEPELLNMEFDIQSKEGRLPDSSYPEEEAWLTWTDITGTFQSSKLLPLSYVHTLVLMLYLPPLSSSPIFMQVYRS